MGGGKGEHQRLVHGLDEAHVYQGGVQRLCGGPGLMQQGAKRQYGGALAITNDAALAECQRCHLAHYLAAAAAATGIAHRSGLVALIAGEEHLAALVLVGRRHHHHVRHCAQEADVERPLMGGAVGAYQAGPVDGEQHRQVLQRHIVDQLVIGPLQEARIDGDHGFLVGDGKASGEGDRMLFGDGYVEVAIRILLAELDQAGALAHGGSDADQPLILGRHVAQPLAEDGGEGWLATGTLGQGTLVRIELGDGVIADGVFLGRLVALALLGLDVQQLGAFEVAHVAQGLDQSVDVVAVDGAYVVEAELLEQGAWHHHALEVLLGPLGQLLDRRQPRQHLLAAFADGGVELARHQSGQVVVERPDILGDGHLVVIEHHQHVLVNVAGVVEGLEGHACRDGAITDDGHHLAAQSLALGGDRHAEGGTYGGAGVAHAEHVILALFPPGEGVQAIFLANGVNALAPAGQDLVGIGLMAHVPHQSIEGGVVDVVQGNRQLDCAEAGGEVAAGAAHRAQQILAQLFAQNGQPLFGQGSQLDRRIREGQVGEIANINAHIVTVIQRLVGSLDDVIGKRFQNVGIVGQGLQGC